MPHKSERYYSPSPPPRRASRTDSFLDALDRGRVREAFGALRPDGSDKQRHRSQHDSSRRHHHRESGEYYVPDNDDNYYYQYSEYDDDARPRSRHRSHHRDSYYYEDERPKRRSHRESAHGYPDSRSRSHHHGRSRARSEGGSRWKQATEAAVGAGLIEGWRSRHDPHRMSRIATAAAGAAGTAMLVGGENDKKNKRHVTEGTIGGLVLDRMINGSRR